MTKKQIYSIDELQAQLLFDEGNGDRDVELLSSLIDKAELVYLKRMALNDWQWAISDNKHQDGIYIPHEDRDNKKFFPVLEKKLRNIGEPDIWESYFDIQWTDSGTTKSARLVNYKSKGEETHLTGVPKECFIDLNPASFFVLGKIPGDKTTDHNYYALTIDSTSPAMDYLRTIFGFDSQFLSGFFEPAKKVKALKDKALDFIDEAMAAFNAGKIVEFTATHGTFPTTKQMAQKAQIQYLQENHLPGLDPYALKTPGDALMTISRDVEYAIFKEYELKARSLELVSIILGTDPSKTTVASVLRAIITEFPKIDKVLLSAAQQRKSRAGYSFENHISRMLTDGKIPFQEQVILAAKKRPDFVLPSLAVYNDEKRSKQLALVLSAKTTLRERWKQVHGEIKNCDLYLATVDDSIAFNAIEDMASQGIKLVVPESLKESKVTAYKKSKNVISFSKFFNGDLKKKRLPMWITSQV